MKTVTVMNVNDGSTVQFPARLIGHPIFHPSHLVEVVAGTKPYVAELYKPQTAEEFVEKHPEKVSRRSKKDETETGLEAEEEN